MKKTLHMILLLVAVLAFAAVGAYADNGTGPAGTDPPIVVDAGWYGFCFGGAGSAATAGCQNAATAGTVGNDMTFTAATSVLFNITDAFESGDTFSVFVNGPLALTTPSVPLGNPGVTDPNLAFADPAYSHGSIYLNPGTYTVDVFALDSPYGSGGAYVEVVSTPEPSILLLLGIGLAAIGTRLRKRFTAA